MDALRLDLFRRDTLKLDTVQEQTLVERPVGFVISGAPEGWKEYAACKGMEPNPFIIEEGTPEWRQAKLERVRQGLCSLCDVVAQCTAYRRELDIPLVIEPDVVVDLATLR